jgi:hypothetical protein
MTGSVNVLEAHCASSWMPDACHFGWRTTMTPSWIDNRRMIHAPGATHRRQIITLINASLPFLHMRHQTWRLGSHSAGAGGRRDGVGGRERSPLGHRGLANKRDERVAQVSPYSPFLLSPSAKAHCVSSPPFSAIQSIRHVRGGPLTCGALAAELVGLQTCEGRTFHLSIRQDELD